jgi:hypothetical protein
MENELLKITIWLARDRDGKVHSFQVEPIKRDTFWDDKGFGRELLTTRWDEYPGVRWLDEKAKECELVIREKEKVED